MRQHVDQQAIALKVALKYLQRHWKLKLMN
jgi:hypothetical protein